MKKYFLIFIFIVTVLTQTIVSYAQSANQPKPPVYSTPVTFVSLYDKDVTFKIQVQQDEYSVVITSATTGSNNYVITATVMNQDGLDQNFVPNVKQGLITSIKKSDLFFDKLTKDRVYRILIVGRKASDPKAPEVYIGDYSFVDDILNPNITDNSVSDTSTVAQLPPPQVIDPQKNLYTDDTVVTPAAKSKIATTANKTLVGGLVTCGRFQGDTSCGLKELFDLLNRLIKFAIQDIFFPVFIFAILYLGYTFLTSSGNTSAWGKAKKMATNMAIGVLLILGAWLIVYTALNTLGATDATLFFKK